VYLLVDRVRRRCLRAVHRARGALWGGRAAEAPAGLDPQAPRT
jgi:hypothetical protein